MANKYNMVFKQGTDSFIRSKTLGVYFILGCFLMGFNAAAQFGAENIVVVQTSGAVSKGGSAVMLKEYTPNGTPGISVALPDTGATPLQMAAGSGGSEGFLTRSLDGTFLVLAGYSTSTTDIVDITASTAVTAPRVIFKVDALGHYTQVGASTKSYDANDIRGAVSDGINFWAAGASGTTDGINYYGPSSPVSLGVGLKAYGLQIFNNQIYFSTQKVVKGITPNFGIYALGTGMPINGTILPTLMINTDVATPEDFSINPTGDTCYIAINLNSPTGGIQKWSKSVAGTWTLNYTLGTGVTNVGAYGLLVDYSAAHAVIYATTNEANTVGNRVIKITDMGVSSVATTLVAATTNTFFHGISFAPTCLLPMQPAAFTASAATVTPGQTNITYTVPNDTTVTYSWSYTGKGVTINGSGNSVLVNFAAAATSGVLRVKASNACGTSNDRSQAISVAGAIRITEFMYSGTNGEFVEFTNVGGADVDMNGWSFDNINRTPGVHDLSSFGIVKPGESVIVTETDAATFRTAWNLCSGMKIVGGYTTDKLSRNDEINLYNGTTLIDRLTYNDQTTGGGPRTQNKSAWVSLAGLGNNLASQYTLSAVGDAEKSFTSTGSDIASPGKTTLAPMPYSPCVVINDAPSIIYDLSTTNYLDGGVLVAPISSYGISGVISDPTDPASTLGINFTVGDAETAVANLTVTASSSNTAIVPLANLVLTGSGASRNLKITPIAVGYITVTITVNDGTNNTNFVLNYAASATSATPSRTVWSTGMSDASEAIPLDDNYYISNDDEINVLNVYSRSASGLPLVSYDYTSGLNLPNPAKPEADLEAGIRSSTISNRIYWLGSMSNSKAPFTNLPNRNRLFATNISGTGASTTFSLVGYYGDLRAQLIAWGDANEYDFTSSAAEGVDSKLPNGFAAEGMAFAPDNTTLYIGMRAPLVPMTTRTKAVLAPITNFETWFNNGNPSGNPVFAAPVELNLGGRGVRGMTRLTNGTYIIVAGNPAGDPITSAIFKWTGDASNAPILVSTSANDVLNMEGAMQVNTSGKLSSTQLQVISDLGGDVLYNDGTESKDFADLKLRKFRCDLLTDLDLCFTLPTPTITTNGNTLVSSASMGNQWYLNGDIIDGAVFQNFKLSLAGDYTVMVTDEGNCKSASSAVTPIVVTGLASETFESTAACVFPNPFSEVFTLNYHLNSSAEVSAQLIDLTGKPVATLIDKEAMSAGDHQYVFDASSHQLFNGMYLLKITTGTSSQLIKVHFGQ